MQNWTLKELADAYEVSRKTLYNYTKQHKETLCTMQNKYNGQCSRRFLNSLQITYIVNDIMKDTPEGYELIDGKLIKIKE
jgi:predicted DNA-binding protein YlxM (UPF0122 family)